MTEQYTHGTPEAVPQRRRLTRSRGRKVIAGVCEGAGRYFDIDPVVFRIVLGVLALTGGLGLVAYGLGWLLIPAEGAGGNGEPAESEAHRLLSGRVEGAALTAVLMALVGCGLFLSLLGSGGNLAFSLGLVAAFAGAVYWSQHRQRTAQAPVPGTAPPPPTQPPPAPATPAWWKDGPVEDAAPAAGGGGYLWGPDDGPADDERDRHEWRRRRQAVRREGAWLGVPVFFLAVAAATACVAAAWNSQPLGTALQIGFAAALAVFGLGFAVSGWWGRLGGGTVFAVVLTAALLVGSSVLPKSVGHEWQHRTWTPATVASVQGSYELGTGQATLDLSGLEPGGRTVATRAQVGAGQIVVKVPADVTLELHVSVGLGDVQLPGDGEEDVDVQPGVDKTVRLEPADGKKSTGTLKLEVEMGVGQVQVTR
ncbi:PspC domain-containing protein [Streptomyces sp. NPDC088354]|uniref:PspC domain-containing protein n=1 Tax=unclassified Streptomyces TaxID=2593676 RepID=UPI0029AAADF0|nr:PspC domain-containing protein [Streptomyces sp. MI02-7b]MDX3071879.1 PspC domain-containing protein [Streptomyces sp. MI02-7b]